MILGKQAMRVMNKVTTSRAISSQKGFAPSSRSTRPSVLHREAKASDTSRHTQRPSPLQAAAEVVPNSSGDPKIVSSENPKGAEVVFRSWPAGQKKTGSSVVITGGSQGVGKALSKLFAKAGYNVILVAREPTRLAAAGQEAAAVAAAGRGVVSVSTDITDEGSVNAMAGIVGENFQTLDLVVNNAGVCATGAVEDTPLSAMRRLVDINFIGHYLVTCALLPAVRAAAQKQQGGGAASFLQRKPAIVMVNSFAARIPLKNMGGYTASKYALAGFTDVLRAEVSGAGIFVGQVHPGVIKSNFLERAEWYGAAGERSQKMMSPLISDAPGGGGGGGVEAAAGGSLGAILQTPEEVAQAAFDCATKQQQTEVVVGPVFNAAVQGYRLSGFNPFDLA